MFPSVIWPLSQTLYVNSNFVSFTESTLLKMDGSHRKQAHAKPRTRWWFVHKWTQMFSKTGSIQPAFKCKIRLQHVISSRDVRWETLMSKSTLMSCRKKHLDDPTYTLMNRTRYPTAGSRKKRTCRRLTFLIKLMVSKEG